MLLIIQGQAEAFKFLSFTGNGEDNLQLAYSHGGYNWKH